MSDRSRRIPAASLGRWLMRRPVGRHIALSRGGRHRRIAIAELCSGIACALALHGAAQPVAAAEQTFVALQGEDAVAQLQREGSYDALAAATAEARYAITRAARVATSNGEPAYEALNPARDLRTAFTSTGIYIDSIGTRSWHLGMQLKSYGYGEQQLGVTSGATQVQGDRIETAQHTVEGRESAALVEWYVNTPRGLEQGFTITAQPDGSAEPSSTNHGRTSAGWLRLTLALTGDVQAELSADRQAVRLKDRRGRPVASYDHLVAWDAVGHTLPARMAVRGREVSLEVDDRAAQYPIVVDPLVWQEAAKATGEPNAFDEAGYSVAISGDRVVVGCHHSQFSHGSGFDTNGKAFVFVRKPAPAPGESPWQYEATLEPPGGHHTQAYGTAVAISGDTAVVGDWTGSTDIDSTEYVYGAGAAYIWVRSGTDWTLQQRIAASDPFYNSFGYSVAISGETVIVGAPDYGRFTITFKQGKAYVFVRNGGAWTEEKQLEADDGAREDQFGYAVAISGDTAIVGAPYHDVVAGGGASEDQGEVYAFVRNAGNWSAPSRLVGSLGAPFDNFGLAVGVSRDTAVIGTGVGVAYVFGRDGSWNERQIVAADDSQPTDAFGLSVAIADDTIVVGAPFADIDQGQTITPHRGAAYVFHREGVFWEAQEKLTASDGAANDVFGLAVAAGSGGLVVGAPGHDIADKANQGEAVIFQPRDADGDALPDEWEKNGVTIEGEFIDLPAMGANPRHKDIFLHLDWMAPTAGKVFTPDPRALRMVVDAFTMAPLTNPDGRAGIDVHVDAGPLSIMKYVTGGSETWGALSRAGEVPFQDTLDSSNPQTTATELQALVPFQAVHFTQAQRSAVFHYVLYCNEIDLGQSGGSSTGLPASNFEVAFDNLAPRILQANTVMHELGHNLGLHHGGGDDVNHKPNYISIMNYRFQVLGTLRPDTRERRLDFSRTALPTLDETHLDEFVGIQDPVGHVTTWNRLSRPLLPAGSNKCVANPNDFFLLFYPTDALDWDCDGVKDVALVAADINSDERCLSSGPDGDLDSAASADDVIIGPGVDGEGAIIRPFITAGPNRICESKAAGDDKQLQGPSTTAQPNLLTGFDDWNKPPAGLTYDGGGVIGRVPSAATAARALNSPPNTRPDEVPLEELLAEVPPDLLDEQVKAPLDVVTFAPQAGGAPLHVVFDGASSTAVDGTIADWDWDFGDGATGSGATTAHTYDAPGEYFATLTVTDSNGYVNLVPLLQRVVVTEGAPATATPTATPPTTPAPTPSSIPTGTAVTPVPTSLASATTTATGNPVATPTPLGNVGDVDPTFDATVTSTYGRPIYEAVTQPDGKVIVGGDFDSFGGCASKNIARVNADGSCDRTFDPGLALTEVFDNLVVVGGKTRLGLDVQALALQPDGKILVGVNGTHSKKDGVVTASKMIVRLNADGTLDASFELHGVPLTAESSGPTVVAIALQTDGRILIAGNFIYSNNGTRGYIARLQSDGNLDASFAAPLGLLRPGFGDNYAALAIQPDGKIIVGGSFIEGLPVSATPILRLNSDGSRDAAFNVEQSPGSGLWACEFSAFSDIRALALQPDGKIVVAGNLAPRDQSGTFLFARLNADGSRDPSFATTFGTNASGFAVRDSARALLLQPDSKVIVAGSFRTTTPAIRNSIARLNADGTLDATFDTPGMNTTGAQYSSDYYVYALARHANGKIVVGGSYDTFNGAPAEKILRLETNGGRDASFESNGPGAHAEVNVLLRQPDGKLLVGFYPKITTLSQATKVNGVRRGGIGRLKADGSIDAGFTSPFDAESVVYGVALQADGKAVIGGIFRPIGSPGQELHFARLNANGTFDTGFNPPSGGGVELGNNQAFAIQPDQKILAFKSGPFGARELIRLNPDGSPDATFSIALPNGAVEHIAMQPDGKIVITGFFYLPSGLPARLARLNPDGSFDATFDPGTGPDERVRVLVLQPDGHMLIGGKFLAYDGTARNQIARVNANGSLDAGFLPVNDNPSTDHGREISAFGLQADGRILVGTNSFGNNAHPPPNRVFRLNPNGSLDASFPLGTGVEGLGVSVNTMVLQPDETVVIGGEFNVVNGVARLALARILGPAPPAPAASLDQFVFYKVKPSKGAPKFAPLGPLTLADAASTTDVDVRKLTALGLPGEIAGENVNDELTHLVDYSVKLRKTGTKFRPIPDVDVENPCGALVVTVKKPEDLLVAAHVDLEHPALPPAADTHEVADFRCYKVKVQKNRGNGAPALPFPKGAQVDAVDQFQSRRYDLKKLTRVCYPVAESGAPLVLKTGAPFPFTPAALRHDTVHLACYQAKPAKRHIAQDGCGPLDPKDKGTKIVPGQPKHQKRTGVNVSSQLGSGALDTAKEVEICIPSTVSAP